MLKLKHPTVSPTVLQYAYSAQCTAKDTKTEHHTLVKGKQIAQLFANTGMECAKPGTVGVGAGSLCVFLLALVCLCVLDGREGIYKNYVRPA